MKTGAHIIVTISFALSALFMNFSLSKMAINKSNLPTDIYQSTAAPLQETHWSLIEIMGKRIPASDVNKEIYIVLRKEQNKVEGNGGCNAIAGSYTLGKKNQIAFSQMVSTKMMCPSIKYEDEFLKSLASADHYYLNADTLVLTHGKLLPLAKFVAKE